MTTDDYGTGQISPWHRYLQREHAARDAYLAVTVRAHAEYLTGPWPDRDSYQVVERQAWLTYYTAGRAAWQMYRHEIDTPPPPPAPPTDIRLPDPSGRAVYPAQPYDRDLPAFHPTNGGTQLWPPNYRATSAATKPRY
jgi:hypothetical protein